MHAWSIRAFILTVCSVYFMLTKYCTLEVSFTHFNWSWFEPDSRNCLDRIEISNVYNACDYSIFLLITTSISENSDAPPRRSIEPVRMQWVCEFFSLRTDIGWQPKIRSFTTISTMDIDNVQKAMRVSAISHVLLLE